jgi:hypothetical protein
MGHSAGLDTARSVSPLHKRAQLWICGDLDSDRNRFQKAGGVWGLVDLYVDVAIGWL